MSVQSVVLKVLNVDIPSAGTAVKLSSISIKTTRFEMHVPNANTGSVFIGDSTVDNTWIGRGKATAADNEDGTYLFVASEDAGLMRGDFFDLSKIFVDADNDGDDVIIQYLAASS